MKILAIAHCSGVMGANRSLATTVQGMVAAGIECTIACPADPKAISMFRDLGAIVLASEIPWNCYRRQSLKPRISNIRLGVGTIRKRLTHDRRARVAAERILRQSRTEFAFVYSNSSMTDVGHFVSEITGLPHLWHLREFGDLDYGFRPIYGRSKQRDRLQQATATVSVSEAVRKHLVGNRESAFVVYNGVVTCQSLARLRDVRRRNPRRPTCQNRLAMVGVIHAAKGQQDGLDAFAAAVGRNFGSLSSPRLTFIGPGCTTGLRARALAAGVLDKVCFAGELRNACLALARKDLLLMCSRAEAFGRVIVEAMAAGAIVLARDGGAVREVIRDREDGVIYGSQPQQLADCLLDVCENEQLRLRLQGNAWARVYRDFTIEQYQERMVNLFTNIARSN